ncbi:hypothetical protein EIKCOROL_00077 [Eikenella corrodens ATCC 23834]|uniref:Uncharacterized protein n=1 Tax=Eikenella corrodens ATCC 23834 TaxID=546274 RepID=C0DRW1_EIKCO|nr:hypothetical protein EIKCOROL_00077 [Eikenella corrodens ATCC 23834]
MKMKNGRRWQAAQVRQGEPTPQHSFSIIKISGSLFSVKQAT